MSVCRRVRSVSTPSTVTTFHRRDLMPVWPEDTLLLVPGARELFTRSMGAPGSVRLMVSDTNSTFRFSGLVSCP